MAIPIHLPHVGESVTEAVIGKWLKSNGDAISKFDPIVEVVTDKVTMEVPAPDSGTITRIVAPEGSTVAMGAIIAEYEPAAQARHSLQPHVDQGRVGTLIAGANVGPTGGVFQDTSTHVVATAPADRNDAPNQAETQSVLYSPVVLRLAAEHRIDLSGLKGTGLGGRITKSDVLLAVAGQAPATPVSKPSAAVDDSADTVIEPTPVRRLIAAHMTRSVREIPHAWTAIEVDVTGLVECRKAKRQEFASTNAIDLTYIPFTMYAVAQTLRNHPLLNSSWEDGKIRLKRQLNIGLAVAAPAGLVVPVVHDADRQSIGGLARKIAPLGADARSGKLSLENVRGGTFTLNNTGALDSVWGGAIINHPQAAILTTEAIIRRPVASSGPDGESVVIRAMMNICLSFDHRIIDGSEASGFMQDVRGALDTITAATQLE